MNNKPSQKIQKQVKQIMNDTSFREARSDQDTVRVWENYREQALLWRGLALLQILVTFISIIAAIFFYVNRQINLNVPAKPLPGYYPAGEIPQSEFISVATDFVNLIGTYQHRIAERQFTEASKFLVEPILSKFETDIIKTELNLVVQTLRTQMFFVNPTRTAFRAIDQKNVAVDLIGDRIKTIAGKEYDSQIIKYTVYLTTVPRNTFNPYGIVIYNLELAKLEF
jgi:hypothetical protein